MSNNNNVRATPDDQQPPQASASTNSATRAGDVFLDGVSQEMTAQSSANDNVEKFPREKVSESVRADSSGNQILWRVISDAPSRYNIKYVLAECACGTRREVQAADIRTGRSRSCRSCASTTHGHTKGRRSETFETWHSMIRRCADPGRLASLPYRRGNSRTSSIGRIPRSRDRRNDDSMDLRTSLTIPAVSLVATSSKVSEIWSRKIWANIP